MELCVAVEDLFSCVVNGSDLVLVFYGGKRFVKGVLLVDFQVWQWRDWGLVVCLTVLGRADGGVLKKVAFGRGLTGTGLHLAKGLGRRQFSVFECFEL